MQISNEQKQAFQQVKVFTKREQYFGIPSRIFFNVVGFSIGLGALLNSPVTAIVFLTVLGGPMYKIHKKDPQALEIWFRALSRPYNRWCAGRSDSRKLYILTKEDI